jgi:hypothetical protein
MREPIRNVLALDAEGKPVTRLNATLHGRSRYREEDVPGHNVFHGYTHPGEGDAVDLFATPHTPVYLVEGASLFYSHPCAGGYVQYWQGQNFLEVFAHVQPLYFAIGKNILMGGIEIGRVGGLLRDPHLHFECWRLNGGSIVGETPAGYVEHLRQVLEALT